MSIIRSSVIGAWHPFSEPLEARVPYMYVDVLGLVTTGVGNLIDSVAAAQKLPWRKPGGQLASASEVAGHWQLLKDNRARLAKLHHRYTKIFFENAYGFALTLSDAAIDKVVADKLESNADYLEARHFPNFAEYNADLQLVLLSIAWAVGPGFPVKFPTFTRAVNNDDMKVAVEQCAIRTAGNPGVIPRNYLNMAHLIADGPDADRLYGPCQLGVGHVGAKGMDRWPVLRDWATAHGIQFVTDSSGKSKVFALPRAVA